MPFQGHTPQKKSQCVTWKIESNYVTGVSRKFRTTYQINPPTRPSILRWVPNFEQHGNVENRNASGRHPVSQRTIQTVLNYFAVHSRRSRRRAESDLYLPRYTIHYILRRKILMFRAKIGVFSNCDHST